jgi:hypothetical protein
MASPTVKDSYINCEYIYFKLDGNSGRLPYELLFRVEKSTLATSQTNRIQSDKDTHKSPENNRIWENVSLTATTRQITWFHTRADSAGLDPSAHWSGQGSQ